MTDQERAELLHRLSLRGKRECKEVGEYVAEHIDGVDYAATWTGGLSRVDSLNPNRYHRIG